MDEHLTNIIEKAIRDFKYPGSDHKKWHTEETFVSQAVTAAGYRLDPYPSGKTKDELIKRIEELEAERDKARNIIREAVAATIGSTEVTIKASLFLSSTSLVHG